MRAPEQKKSRNWGRIALIGSLAVNLLVVGTLIGAMVGGGSHFHNRAKPPGMRAYVHSLPDGLSKEYRDRSKGAHRMFNQRLRNGQETNDRILKELRSETFDSEALLAAMGARSHAILGALEGFHSVLVELVDDMSLEERRAYADKVEEFQKRKRRSR